MRPGPERDLTDDIARAKALFKEGTSVEDVIRELRVRGCIQVHVTEVLRLAAGYSHEEAKRAVVFSEAWSDFREATMALHDTIEGALEEMREGEGQPDDPPLIEK